MTLTLAFNQDKLFEGSLQLLRVEAEFFSRLSGQNAELGRLNESHLVKLLRAYLPPKIGIGTGFIVCGGKQPRQSPQCDIILYDALNNAPFYQSDTWSIYPIEMVYGVIEVKTNLYKEHLKDAFEKCAELRLMSRTSDNEGNKSYMRQRRPQPNKPVEYCTYFDKLAPRFFVFAYSGWKLSENFETAFRELSESTGGVHIHGLCYLQDQLSLYVYHKAYKEGPDRVSAVEENGFRAFLLALPLALDSMVPVYRRGLGFDQVNRDHYGMSLS